MHFLMVICETEGGYIFFENNDRNVYLIGYNGTDTELILSDTYNGKNYEIYECAFRGCSSLTSVMIGNSVTSIGYNAFDGCSKLSKVYYKGTSAEWSNISIENTYLGNLALTRVPRYYYSETQPTDSGKYWHYAEDGVTIVEW